jgi:hypothetical protein
MDLKLPKSKRLRFAIYTFHVYIILGIFGVIMGANLADLGVFCSTTSIPLIAYILGDSYRPSKLENIEE